VKNRLHNVTNPAQGPAKKVLCVCSAGLLRSPTAAWVLGNPPFNFNTRAAGLMEEYALIPVDDVLLTWADEIVTMEGWQSDIVLTRLCGLKMDTPVYNLDVEDAYNRMDLALQKQIADRYTERTNYVRITLV
jgi:predicted protein tyrosine phosphatase